LKASKIHGGVLALAAQIIVSTATTFPGPYSNGLAMEVDSFLRAHGVDATMRLLGENYVTNCKPENRYYVCGRVIVVRAEYVASAGLAGVEPELNRFLYLLYESSISDVVRGISLQVSSLLKWVAGVREPDSDTMY
jgi:hypothetical protein